MLDTLLLIKNEIPYPEADLSRSGTEWSDQKNL